MGRRDRDHRLQEFRRGRVRAAALCAAIALVSGCASDGARPPRAEPQEVRIEADLAPIDRLILAAAARAAAALEALRAMRAAGGSGAAASAVPGAPPPELLRRLSMPWTGPLAAAAEKLAAEAGYAFEEIGGAGDPVMIDLGARPRPLVMLLRDIGIQAGTRAVVRVDPAHKRIEVIHDPA